MLSLQEGQPWGSEAAVRDCPEDGGAADKTVAAGDHRSGRGAEAAAHLLQGTRLDKKFFRLHCRLMCMVSSCYQVSYSCYQVSYQVNRGFASQLGLLTAAWQGSHGRDVCAGADVLRGGGGRHHRGLCKAKCFFYFPDKHMCHTPNTSSLNRL